MPATALCSRTRLVISSGANGMYFPGISVLVTHLNVRYINTDYIIASILRYCKVHNIKISYDIACKWSIYLYDRLKMQHGDVDLTKFSITHLIPKFHLHAHGMKCQVQYSFNYTRGVGRTHGETVEQEWAYINLAALATREMGPGARHSALDDSWGGWNWRKVLGLGIYHHCFLPPHPVLTISDRSIARDEPHQGGRHGIQTTQSG